jgi:hypothetical protein
MLSGFSKEWELKLLLRPQMVTIFRDVMAAGEELTPIPLLLTSLPLMSPILNGLPSSNLTENGFSKLIPENIWLVATVVLVAQGFLTSPLFTRVIQHKHMLNGLSHEDDLFNIIINLSLILNNIIINSYN